ncbi:MAG: hypothetical protein A2017_11325 [Lentisphaerae bacterium GWF2_44_16]|nr:MAG: hypothetical protein A2017_11325 [Lentisphaerae bacterium GWF2_44_16]
MLKFVTCVLLFSALAAYSENDVIKLKNYPSQNPFTDTLRIEYFYSHDDESSFWSQMSLWGSDCYYEGKKINIKILEDHPELTYKVWMQKNPAPLIIILPGLGGHYTSDTVTAFAGLFYGKGYSVLAISSAMNWEFMESAAKTMIPGYTPYDAKDVRNALSIILNDMLERYPALITKKMLMGYSLGAIHALFISDFEAKENLLGIQRYVAINPPIDMLSAMSKLETMFEIWQTWSKDELKNNIIRSTGIYMSLIQHKIPPRAIIPIDEDDAQFIIGYAYHLNLRNIIYSIHTRKDFGFIKTPYSWFSRSALYKEIDSFGFNKYRDTYIKKYFSEVFGESFSFEKLNENSSLMAIEKNLSENQKVRILHNMNDFLLRKKDIEWLRKVMKKKIVFFDRGGHLGNLFTEEFQSQLIESLKDSD